MLKMLRGEAIDIPGQKEKYQPTVEDMRWAANSAAAYVHPRLTSTEVSGSLTISHEDALKELE